MEIASWLGPYAGGTEYDEGRPYISAIDGPGGPIRPIQIGYHNSFPSTARMPLTSPPIFIIIVVIFYYNKL